MPVPPTREERAQQRSEQRALGRELSDRIRESGLTQLDIAAHLGVNPSQLSRWLAGVITWADGPEDFKATVLAAIDSVRASRRMAS